LPKCLWRKQRTYPAQLSQFQKTNKIICISIMKKTMTKENFILWILRKISETISSIQLKRKKILRLSYSKTATKSNLTKNDHNQYQKAQWNTQSIPGSNSNTSWNNLSKAASKIESK
jgi:hypothetical protein